MGELPYAVIFAGGQGTRLWPISRRAAPKQFQSILDTRSMLRMTADRILPVVPAERLFISTSAEYSGLALESLPELSADNLIIEDSPLGPAGAFSLAMTTLTEKFGDVPVITTPSDHYVGSGAGFTAAIREMLEALGSYSVVALGAPPTRIDTSLGYIESRALLGGKVAPAQRMVEKPSRSDLEALGGKDQASWNTACYAVRSADAVAAYAAFEAESGARSDQADPGGAQTTDASHYPWHELAPFFESDEAAIGLILRDVVWRDVGTWAGLLDVLPSSATSDQVILSRSGNVIGSSLDGRKIVAIDVDDIIIVSHDDAVYVISRKAALNSSIIEGWRAEKHRDNPDLL